MKQMEGTDGHVDRRESWRARSYHRKTPSRHACVQGLQCIDLVFDELQRLAAQCEAPELTRFSHLRDRVLDTVALLLRRCLAPTQMWLPLLQHAVLMASSSSVHLRPLLNENSSSRLVTSSSLQRPISMLRRLLIARDFPRALGQDDQQPDKNRAGLHQHFPSGFHRRQSCRGTADGPCGAASCRGGSSRCPRSLSTRFFSITPA